MSDKKHPLEIPSWLRERMGASGDPKLDGLRGPSIPAVRRRTGPPRPVIAPLQPAPVSKPAPQATPEPAPEPIPEDNSAARQPATLPPEEVEGFDVHFTELPREAPVSPSEHSKAFDVSADLNEIFAADGDYCEITPREAPGPEPAPEPVAANNSAAQQTEPEILSALPVETNDELTDEPVIKPGDVGELESGVPTSLLLDEMKKGDILQKLQNFARDSHLPSERVSHDDWVAEAEVVLLWKFNQLEQYLKQVGQAQGNVFTDAQISQMSDAEMRNLDPQLIHAVAQLPPEDKTTRSLAVWLMMCFGLESYERNSFWSRCFPSENWKRWHGTGTKYKTGFIYEPVQEAQLLRKLQDVSDDPNFKTDDGVKIGNLSLNKRDEILKELRLMLDPSGGGANAVFRDEYLISSTIGKGFATSEEIPKWVSLQQGYNMNDWSVVSRPVEISHKATFAVPCAYDRDADCPIFKGFLEDTFAGAEDKQERIDALLEWIAAAVFGETTRRAKALYLYGYTATGKSVVCELVKLFFPNKHQSTLGFDDMEDKVSRGDLSQSRLNVMVEAAKSGNQKAFGSSTFKSAVSGEEIRCDVKFRAGYSFRPRTAFLYAANGRMPLNDCDDSIFRRLIIVHFQNPVPEDQQDPDLINKLKGELSGILNLILEAGVGLMKRTGMLDPPSSKALKRRWAGQTNSVKAFLDEECRFIPDLWTNKTKYSRKKAQFSTPITQLHRAYKNWCEVDGLRAVGIREFRNRLDGLGIKTKELNDGTRVPVLMLDPDKFVEGLRLA